MLSGADLKDVPALLIVDLFPRPGDLLQAFCAQRALQSNTSLFYLGVCGDQVELNYIQNSVIDALADRYLDGSLKVMVTPWPRRSTRKRWNRCPGPTIEPFDAHTG